MRKLLCLSLIICMFMACDKDLSTTYSTKYPVRFYFDVINSTELYNAMGNPGQFVSIRSLGNKVRIENVLGGHDYSLSQIGSSEFEYGLGGLIVGISSTPSMNNTFDPVAYDLACPNCSSASPKRLTVMDNGTAKCKNCGIVYDLNNWGWIVETPSDLGDKELHGLYRYRILFNGTSINVNNR